MNKIITISRQKYDSRMGSRSYAMWTDGDIYTVTTTKGEIKFARLSYDDTWWVEPAEMAEFVLEHRRYISSYAEEIQLGDIPDEGQKFIAKLLGDEFPWESSMWQDRAEYEEYWEPKTPKGFISFLGRGNWVYGDPRKNPLWSDGIMKSYCLSYNRYPGTWDAEYIYHHKEGWYEATIIHHGWERYEMRLKELTAEEGQNLFAAEEERVAREKAAMKEKAKAEKQAAYDRCFAKATEVLGITKHEFNKLIKKFRFTYIHRACNSGNVGELLAYLERRK